MLAIRRSRPSSSCIASNGSIHFSLTSPKTSKSNLNPFAQACLASQKRNASSYGKNREVGEQSSQNVATVRLLSNRSSSRTSSNPTLRSLPLLSSSSKPSTFSITSRNFSSPTNLRLFSTTKHLSSTSTSRAPFEFLVGYAFAGKPRGGEVKETSSSSSESESEEDFNPKEIGFPPDSDVGRWRDSLLGGGEAGEDALMCAGMGLIPSSSSSSTSSSTSSSSQENEDGPILEGGDVVLGVADGVGGWVENGVDPSLFSQALMYHATRKAAKHYACPDRVEDLATDGVSSSSSSSSSSSDSDSDVSSSSSNSSTSTNATSISDFKHHPGSPLSLLQYAYDKVLKEELVEAGSATACIVTLDSTKGILRSANLGDSGFLILRQGSGILNNNNNNQTQAKQKEERVNNNNNHHRGKDRDTPPTSSTRTVSRGRRPSEGVLFASEPLQLGFNCPLQLAKLPKHLAQEGSISNVPNDSALWECRLRDGDIVLLGTDGLFDNVFQSEIVQLTRFIREKHHSAWIAKHGPKSNSNPKSNSSIKNSSSSSSRNPIITSKSSNSTATSSSNLSSSDSNSTSTSESEGLIQDDLAEERAFIEVLAHNLVEYTRMCQFSQTKKSPFEREAERYGMRYPGGKVDDVAVCLALVKER